MPEDDVRRRFSVSLQNFFQLYLPLADEALLWDVSDTPPNRIAHWARDEVVLYDFTTYERIQKQLSAK